jgi:hypothetical protein
MKPVVNKLNTTQPITHDPNYVYLRKKAPEQISPSKTKASLKTTKSALKPLPEKEKHVRRSSRSDSAGHPVKAQTTKSIKNIDLQTEVKRQTAA